MSYSKKALFISIICIIYCLLYELFFIKKEAACEFIYALGVVCNCVALSIIASCIFYFITDYFPKKHQQETANQNIISNLEVLKKIGEKAFIDITGKSSLTKLEFSKVCNDVDLLQQPKNSQDDILFSKVNNWFEYFDCMHKAEKCQIAKIMEFESIIPVEVKLIFIELQKENSIFTDNSLYRKIYNEDINKRSIKAHINDIYSHLSSLVEITDLYNKTSKI
ncbi:MAG: hypothetical protein E7077_11975 [Bacteroidales bacterium]|jgi:hypothetical protein|nr:hypothetical protein [Bacteroidales bacterium]